MARAQAFGAPFLGASICVYLCLSCFFIHKETGMNGMNTDAWVSEHRRFPFLGRRLTAEDAEMGLAKRKGEFSIYGLREWD